jgi:DNA invertase Pin-like site-specific DNA recombinase
MTAHVAYIRVSSVDQQTARQLVDAGITFDKTFTDHASGGSTKRPALEQLKNYVREGDTIHVHSIDRLARNLADLRALITEWREQGVSVRFHKEGLMFKAGESTSPMDDLLLSMLGAVAEFERAIIRERQAEGIAIAKAKGKFKGGKKLIDDNVRAELLESLAGGLSMRKAAAQYGVSLSSVQRIKAEASQESV